jgi:hypothetical protein
VVCFGPESGSQRSVSPKYLPPLQQGRPIRQIDGKPLLVPQLFELRNDLVPLRRRRHLVLLDTATKANEHDLRLQLGQSLFRNVSLNALERIAWQSRETCCLILSAYAPSAE